MAIRRKNDLGLITEVSEEEYKQTLAETQLGMMSEEEYLQLLLRDGLEEEIAVANAQDNLRDYASFIWPVIEAGQQMTTGWATDGICDHLQAVTNGEIKNLAIFVPPGFAKSHLTCVVWPTWEWGPRRMPWLRYITASYSEDLTLGTNRLSRALIDSEIYKKWWRKDANGKDWGIDGKQDTKTQFDTTARGFRFATSTGGTITGKRGHRLIFDDLHSAEDAESETIRAGQIRWLRESAMNRVVDPLITRRVLIMQRLGESDAGAAALELGWTVFCVPMRYDSEHPQRWVGGPLYAKTEKTGREYLTQWGKGDPRTVDGELAFPERFAEPEVAELEEGMDDYAVAGQFQQLPAPRGGGMFKVDKLNFVQPYEVPDGLGESRGWDFAGSKTKKSAYTAHAKVSIDKRGSGMIYIRHAHMARLLPHELETEIVDMAKSDGPDVRQSMPRDPAQAGLFQAHVISNLLHGYTFDFSPETGEKSKRAGPLAAQVNAGKVCLVIDPWNKLVVEQMAKFPNGKFKDLIDALSRAYMDAVMAPEDGGVVPAEGAALVEYEDGVASPFRTR